MTNIIIAGLVLMIIMVQVFFLESLQRYRKIMLPLFTLILAVGTYYFLGDPIERAWTRFYLYQKSMLTGVTGELTSDGKRLKEALTRWGDVRDAVREKTDKQGEGDYDKLYTQAFLAFEKQDFDIALIYFTKLYMLHPEDTSYYQAYANTLLLVDPRNPLIHTLVEAIKTKPERDVGIWLLFAHEQEVLGHQEEARAYYEKALKLMEPGSDLYQAVQERAASH